MFESYLIFYMIDDEKEEVYVLRVIKDLMNWKEILRKVTVFHFSGY